MTGRVIASQLGARMHYAVPRILHAAGLLEHCYTDICSTKSWPRITKMIPPRLRPNALTRLTGRVPEGVPARRLTTFPGFGIRYALARSTARSRSEQTDREIWAGQRFSELVIGRGFRGASAVFGYSGECLEQLTAAREQGLRAVVEQTIAPREIVDDLLAEECDRFPEWASPEPDPHAARYAEREKAEWAKADLILCGSPFVRDGVICKGGAPERCVVVPYGVDSKTAPAPRRQTAPLRVVSIGQVGLRKGSPYVLEAARRMKGRAVFRMVGACDVPPGIRSRLSDAVELAGVVPRAEIHKYFLWADVFLLPSICEGSATVVYEALAAGLPVICTANTGSVVRDNVEGFIVPLRDADAIVAAIEALAGDPDRRLRMAGNAAARAAEFTVPAYGERLLAALRPALRP